MIATEFDTYLLFFFSALGVFNGLLLSIYFLIIAKPWHISNGFFAALLIVLCVRIGKSLFFHFNEHIADIYIHIGISACFFIGPLFYLYCNSIINPNGKVIRYWRLHIVLLALIIGSIGIFFPYRANYGIWQDYLMNSIYLQWLIYMLLSAVVLSSFLVKKFKVKEKLPSVYSWLINVYFGVFAILIAYLTGYYTSYIAGALTFSVITYFLLLFFIFNKNKKGVLYLNSIKKDKLRIPKLEAELLLASFRELMQHEKMYLNPNLKSEEVANRLNLSVHQFSKLLNEHAGKRFSEIINEYRITFSKELMHSNRNLTLEAIGNESGFNSKTSFYAAFKKRVGQTPAQFLRQD